MRRVSSTSASISRRPEPENRCKPSAIGPIADGIQRFSGSGLRDVEALVLDTRRTIQNLDSAISGFERNPQRLLFGGDTVKQYDGRTRR